MRVVYRRNDIIKHTSSKSNNKWKIYGFWTKTGFMCLPNKLLFKLILHNEHFHEILCGIVKVTWKPEICISMHNNNRNRFSLTTTNNAQSMTLKTKYLCVVCFQIRNLKKNVKLHLYNHIKMHHLRTDTVQRWNTYNIIYLYPELFFFF